MSYMIEGAKFGEATTGWLTVTFGPPTEKQPRKKAEWTRLSSREFASVEEAQHWLAANAEHLVRERVVAVRLLQVVAHYAPHCIAFFPEVGRDTVARMTEREPSSTSAWDGTPGEEWKQGKDGDA